MGWTVNFKSISGKDCVIDIGGGGTVITGAADPVTWDETDSDNLLEVVRWRTGNIRIIEPSFGDLDAMHPAKDTDITVVVTYDGCVAFSGFVQAQDFDQPYEPGPREMTLPIVSLLGTAGNRYMTNRETSGTETLGNVMKEICTDLGFTHIIVPALLLENSVNPLQVSVNCRTLCPFNSDYEFGKNDLFSPLSYLEVIEGFCNLYGLIAHDTNDGNGNNVLLFQKAGYDGEWVKMQVSSLDDTSYTGTSSQQQYATFDNIFTPADDDGKVSHIAPLGRIDINYGSLLEEVNMDLKRASLLTPESTLYNVGKVLFFHPLPIAQGGEFYSVLQSDDTSPYSGYSTQGDMVRICGDGNREYIDLSYHIQDINNVSDTPLFEYTFGQVPRTVFSFIMDTLDHLFCYRLQIQSGSKYLMTNQYGAASWTDTPTIIDIFSYTTDKGYIIEDIYPTSEPVTVRILANYRTQTYWGDPITKLSLSVRGNPLNAYLYEDKGLRTIKVAGTEKNTNVKCLFHDYVDNEGRIIGGHISEQDDYSYMFASKKCLTVTVKKTTSGFDISQLYLQNFTIGEDNGWMVLSVNFSPWDDIYELSIVKMPSEERQYDAKVEYLESSGTQWIDTGIVGNQNTKVEVSFKASATYKYLLGSRSNTTTCITLYIHTSAASQRFGNRSASKNISLNTNHILSIDKSYCILDGVSSNVGMDGSFTTPTNLLLMNVSGSSQSASTPFQGRVYYCKIWDNGNLVRDFIPVRKNGVGYMYDKVSGQLFGNANSVGEFTYGNDVTE